jgi:hypothetical protein
LNSPTPLLSPAPSSLIPGTVSTGIIFAFIWMCIYYLHHIHLPVPFPTTSLYWCQPLPPPWTEPVPLSCSSIL